MRKEQKGIEQVTNQEKHSSLSSVGWIWFGANIGVFSLILGAIEQISNLNIMQATVVTSVACTSSFLLVGVISVIGARSGYPTLTVSRKYFGKKGNFITALISWVSILGWEIISVLIVTWCLATLIKNIFRLNNTSFLNEGSLIVAICISLFLAFYGFDVIAKAQKVFSILFGALTLVAIIYLLQSGHSLGGTTNRTVSVSSGSIGFDTLLVIFGTVAAATGISWINLAADFSRYLPKRTSSLRLTVVVTLSSSLPCIALILAGYYLQGTHSTLVDSINPISSLLGGMPNGMADILLVAAAGGMLLETDLASYSSGLNLLVMGVKVRRTRTVFIDLAIVFVGCNTILYLLTNDIPTFENFLLLLADGLLPFAGIAIADLYLTTRKNKNINITTQRVVGDSFHKQQSEFGYEGSSISETYNSETLNSETLSSDTVKSFNVIGISSWLVGVILALTTTVCPFYSGFLAKGFLSDGNFGLYLGFVISMAMYVTFNLIKTTGKQNITGQQNTTGQQKLTGQQNTSSPLVAEYSSILDSQVKPQIELGIRPKRLVLVGSVIVDILMYVDKFVVYGSDQMAKDKHISAGGGFNVLVAAKQSGLDCILAGKVGTGFFGRQITRDLELYNIDFPIGFDKDSDSGFTVGVIDDTKVNTFVTYPGAESKLTLDELNKIEFNDGDAVYISGYDLLYPVSGASIRALISSLSPSVLLVVDSGPLFPKNFNDELLEFLRYVDIFTLNETEAMTLTNETNAKKSAHLISSMLKDTGIAIVRLGAGGCYVCQNKKLPVHVRTSSNNTLKDTVGAGDIHTAVLLAALSFDLEFLDAIQFANEVATKSTGHKGGSNRDELFKYTEGFIKNLSKKDSMQIEADDFR